MDVKLKQSRHKSHLLEAIMQRVEERVHPPESAGMAAFVRLYLESVPTEEFSGRDFDDIYGAIFSCWRFLQNFDGDKPKISIFNPSHARHGWQSPRTVIAVLANDTPFIIDSLRIELNRRGIAIEAIHSHVFAIDRDESGQLQALSSGSSQVEARREATWSKGEAMVFMEVTRQSSAELFEDLGRSFADILAEVSLAVDSFHDMRDQARALSGAVAGVEDGSAGGSQQAARFMQWLADNHFTFLAYASYAVPATGADLTLAALQENAMGLFVHCSAEQLADINTELLQQTTVANAIEPLFFAKSSLRSRVHRNAWPDYVTIRLSDNDGSVIEHRFLGLYTSNVYNDSPRHIPVVCDKFDYVREHAGLDLASHDGKELTQLLESYPRDELFLSTVPELLHTTKAIWGIQERRQVRLFARAGQHNKFVYCLVYTPRDIYRTEIRARVQAILKDALGAEDADFTTYFSESVLTRTYFVFRVNPNVVLDFDVVALERKISDSAQQWSDLFCKALVEELGEEQGVAQARLYEHAFPAGYRDDFVPRTAVNDVKKIAELDGSQDISMHVYRVPEEPAHVLRFRLYHFNDPLALSDLLPPLENFGLRVVAARPYQLNRGDGAHIWVHDFSLEYTLGESLSLEKIQFKFQEAFERIWVGDAENDRFNRLLLGSQMGWRDIAMLRAYAHYMQQTRFNFREDYIADTLCKYLELSNALAMYFKCRFDPDFAASKQQIDGAEDLLLAHIDDVENLNEDRIARQYFALIQATLRTNFYQPMAAESLVSANGAANNTVELKPYFAFKINPAAIPELPKPVPMFEVFVYSPHVEGIHLRGGKVARGGLRWSDRREDFRTEVLGLVKAQQVKNAVIVPVGAKGGFVAKQLPVDGTREDIQAEGIACYKTFISGLLDITDNIVDAEVVPPTAVIRHDEDDPYLVVAADKGTATFSDIANEISADYGFWLGDAFASGGSVGYDHKKMGITAKGAWVSVQRHFRERDIDVQTQDFTVLGIGDMAGDVFGNGMLLSEHILLTAAFNHLHIFIDPAPNAAVSFAERQRLFALPRSSWADYDLALISAGGGIFPRSAKSIPISPEMKERFAITANKLTPNALISALLTAPLDLLWNGGIGTYIKASSESHVDVGDKANDALRIDACDLRCKVIGEGGNLGLTQLARSEFALHGGACNTDFIDNAGGVDCSDHEVNIKILLNDIVTNGDMTEKQRRQLLETMTDEVSSLVLDNNYGQVQAISIAETEAARRHGEYRRLISAMENAGKLNRELEFLPTDETLVEREGQHKALVRPELSVLISYTKALLKEDLGDSNITDNTYMSAAVATAFPRQLTENFAVEIQQHRLYREIAATQVANDLVNHMGISYINRMQNSTGAASHQIARAYVTARDIFSMPQYWQQIEGLDHQLPAATQMLLMRALMRLVRRGSRWFLRNRRTDIDPEQEIARFKPGIDAISASMDGLFHGHLQELWSGRREELLAADVPLALANLVAGAPGLFASLGIVEAARYTGMDASKVAKVYFSLGEKLDMHWFGQQVADLPVDTHWQALARETFRDDIEWQQSAVTVSVLRCMQRDIESETSGDDVCIDSCIDAWLVSRAEDLERWRAIVNDLRASHSHDFAVYTVATRALFDLAQASNVGE